MTKLLLIIPNVGAGGAQKVFRDQFLFYSKHFETIACVFNTDGSLPVDRELKLLSLDVPAGSNIFSKAWRFIQRIQRLRYIKSKYKIDISISHLEGADYVNLLSKKKDKTICWIHGTKKFDGDIRGVVGWIRTKVLMPLLYKRSDKIITVSDGIKNEMIDIGIMPSRIETILNGIDIDQLQLKAKETPLFLISQLGKDVPVIFTHCRLAPQKNINGLIEIFARVRSKMDAKLVIAGDGELRDQLISLAEARGLKVFSSPRNDVFTDSYDIYFTGHQSNPYPLLAASSIYAMTSSWEGFPLALGEAIACGVPSISADCFTGPREILASGLSIKQPVTMPYDSGIGMLMPMADSSLNYDIWCDAICSLLSDSSRRVKYSEAGKVRIKELDQEEVNRKWLALIND